ncbi:hypothetical protein Q7P37_007362 [Cladosporium fusiforme]
MSTPQAQSEAVRTAISSGNATASTVTTLQSLLSAETKVKTASKTGNAPVDSKTTAKRPTATAKPASKVPNKSNSIEVHKDGSRSLAPKERYTLATEVVNLTLKVLSEALKSQLKNKPTTTATPGTPRRLSRTTSGASQRALQPRSGNSTPAPATPRKSQGSSEKPPQRQAAATDESAPHLLATGECSRLAFSFLRSANTKQLGVRELPPLQLENGMLALVGKLIPLGLDSLAIKELRIVKAKLESTGKARPSSPPEKETLAGLLQVRIDPEKQPSILSLAITYQSLVLRVIASSSKPATIEACVEYLNDAQPLSPAGLISLQGQTSKDHAKAGRLLEALSSTVLGLCPSLSSKQDSLAVNRDLNPAPEAVLELQKIGLRIRKQWWQLVGHKPDVEKELLDPVSRCISAFVRRTKKTRSAQQIYAVANQGVEELIADHKTSTSKASFAICRTLSSIAEESGNTEDAHKWSAVMSAQSQSLESTNAQRIAATARRMLGPDSKISAEPLAELTEALQSKMSGNTSDYEYLLAELARLLSKISPGSHDSDDVQKLSTLATTFALKFVRSYPGQNLTTAESIIHHALRHSASSDAPLTWINEEAIHILLDNGALDSVTKAALITPFEAAWASSTAAITLARALRLLILRSLKSCSEGSSATIFDNKTLDLSARGLLLEWQLKVATEYSSKSRYHAVLKELLPRIVEKLRALQLSSKHPVRFANLAIHIFRVGEGYPNLLLPHVCQPWMHAQLDLEALSEDAGLGGYAADIDASLRLTKILHDGHPSIRNLKPILLSWQRLLDDVTDDAALGSRVYDSAAFRLSLLSTATLFGALGEDTHRLCVLALIKKLDSLESCAKNIVASSVRSAKQWLSMGFSEKSGSILIQSERHLGSDDLSTLSKIQWHLAYAEYLLAADNLGKCKSHLEKAQELRSDLPPKGVSKDERAAYERTHAEGWLLQSNYNLACGAPHDALAAGKHAMKIVNSAWTRLEKGQASDARQQEEESMEPTKHEVAELSAGVSKLRLTPKDSQKDAAHENIKGAAFWPLIPLLCRSLTHLSDMYAHHGLFTEADYYSGKAIETAESVGSSVLLSRMRSHRGQLLSLAGKVAEAELCLIGSEGADLSSSPLAAVDRLQAQAAVHAKDGSVEEAAKLYEESAQLVLNMQSEDHVSRLDRFEDPNDKAKPAALAVPAARPAPAAKIARSSARTRKPAGKTVAKAKPTARAAKTTCDEKSFYLLQKRRAMLLLEKAVLEVNTSNDEEGVLQALAPLKTAISGTLRQRRVQYQQLMTKAAAALQMDFVHNILLDSTLSFPALLRTTPAEQLSQPSSPPRKAASSRPSTRTGQRKTAVKTSFQDTFKEARACLVTGHSSISRYCSSAEIHSEGGKLLDVSILCSSIESTGTNAALNPVQAALTLDFPRINALEFERKAAMADATHEQRTTPFEWPALAAEEPAPQLNAATFQESYINTIPKPWTAVSLYLDESSTSLYVARYRAGHSPFVVRLPFSRHQDEEIGDEAFDYAAGAEELRDIIQASNTSCHNNSDLSAKGAKSSWWSEREALDRRLQELLINIEDIWFGGFKGVLSPRARQPELLARFRASFEAALDRHLPSRQTTKGRAEPFALDSNVLELFINLGSDNEGAIDMDEPISDLLYFVVDMLQFNGERNAYDEIDFDEMTVEVLDALRSYHEASEVKHSDDQHVVLVLDKRLQAFPWENLPCLEGVSVSRVGSMLSLRDCIGAMRAESRHLVSRKSGAFILNPSSDLASTQTTLEPSLAKAAAVEGASWSSIVNRAPQEDEFKATLETSAMTLYFGHGAGSQYVRPRTIKKLDKCSEVVWLMGCSSGAVTEHGELEPQAVPLAYLNAGRKSCPAETQQEPAQNSKCLAVVATLWDVTDKDIDRFSLTVGEEWGLWASPPEPSKAPSKTPKKRERLVAPSTPPRAPKTPKTPKAKKTPATSKTPVRDRSRSKPRAERGEASLAGAVAKSRDACYLRYLNGAAPVVYGVPVYLGD